MSPPDDAPARAPESADELFEQARRLRDPAERDAFLEARCTGAPALKIRLARLLALDDAAGKFFDFAPQADLVLPRPADEAASAPSGISTAGAAAGSTAGSPAGADSAERGLVIDHYKLLRRLGEGGCGVVYMAEQLEPVRRHVALKIIRPGMDTPVGLAAFEMERRALALMDHPNIARVLEAGATPSGLPYFVMEWVQGARITDHCDEHRLDLRARLDLFIRICHAVQHAHQKGVIHRDIKPSNILVTLQDGQSIPKLIDFGIARPTDEGFPIPSDAARLAPIGTPAYMSPEQAAGDSADIDTRSDVYSLGVLLCELLAGRPPLELPDISTRKVPAALSRLLGQSPPRPPSALLAELDPAALAAVSARRGLSARKLVPALLGDLDWIVLRAVATDPKKRYQTANALAADIARWLAHEAVSAHPAGRLYRLRKLVRRNRSVFVTVTVVALALGAGFGTSTWLFLREREARREQARLRQEAEAARVVETELRQRAEVRERISQAAVLLSHQETAAADALLGSPPAAFIPPSLECANLMRSLGTWHALAGRWREAAVRYHAFGIAIAHCDDADTDDISREFVPAAAAICEAGDDELYHDFRDLMLRRFGSTANTVVAEQIIKTALLQPADAKILDQLVPLAELVRKQLSPDGPAGDANAHMAGWSAFSLALLEYRRDRPAPAIEWAERCLAYRTTNPPRRAAALALLALARERLGRHDEAALALAQAREISASRPDGTLSAKGRHEDFWFDWINARVLVREAEQTLAPRAGG